MSLPDQVCDSLRGVRRRLLEPELRTFLAVGGTGYVVDVCTFNVLRSVVPFDTLDPSVARTLAVAVAMVVTYVGNATLTWRDRSDGNRTREISLFVLFNVIGFGFSVVTLVVSHDLLGLTGRLADNISANVVGLALGTVFRYVSYKRWVFAMPTMPLHACAERGPQPSGARQVEDSGTMPVG